MTRLLVFPIWTAGALVSFASSASCGSGGSAGDATFNGEPSGGPTPPVGEGAQCGTVSKTGLDGGLVTTTTDCQPGLTCGYRQKGTAGAGTFDQGKCVTPTTAAAGQPCSGYNDPGVSCTGGSTCISALDSSPPSFVCFSLGAAGSPCRWGEECTDGVCGAGHCSTGAPGDACDADQDPGRLPQCRGSCVSGRCK